MNPKFMKTYFDFKTITYNLRDGPSLSAKPNYFGTNYLKLFKIQLL